MRKALPFIALGVIVIAIILLLQPNRTTTNTQTDGRMSVVASFYPIAEFARQVGGSAVMVATITPAGVEPHEYEPTSQELQSVYAADVFLYNGSGLDPWAERVAQDVASHGVTVAKMSDGVQMIENDPHLWLNPTTAKQEVAFIKTTLTKADPTHASDFATNAETYASELDHLDATYKTGLSDCDKRIVVTSHAAFAYLANAYNFTAEAIAGISPEEEPSAGRLAEIAQMAKEQQIKYIYFETLVSPKLADTIAREVGATTLVFNPLEGLTDEETARGENYLTVMEENLNNLRIGMLCR